MSCQPVVLLLLPLSEGREKKQSFINDSKSNLGPGHGGGVFFVVVIKKKKQKRVRTKYLEKTTRTISSWGIFFFKKMQCVRLFTRADAGVNLQLPTAFKLFL